MAQQTEARLVPDEYGQLLDRGEKLRLNLAVWDVVILQRHPVLEESSTKGPLDRHVQRLVNSAAASRTPGPFVATPERRCLPEG
jgi:hypothetical protein